MDAPDELTGPVNLGNPAEFSIKELAEQVIGLTGTRSKLVHQELPEDDPARRCPDITLAKEQLGWEPSIALGEGLKKTISYFDSII